MVSFSLLYFFSLYWLWWTFVCFARWKLPTETSVLEVNKWLFLSYSLNYQSLVIASLLKHLCWQFKLEHALVGIKGTTSASLPCCSFPSIPLLKDESALGSDNTWTEMPLCGRPRKPRPLITVLHNFKLHQTFPVRKANLIPKVLSISTLLFSCFNSLGRSSSLYPCAFYFYDEEFRWRVWTGNRWRHKSNINHSCLLISFLLYTRTLLKHHGMC